MKKLYDLVFSPHEPSNHWDEIRRVCHLDKSRYGLITIEFLNLIDRDFRIAMSKELRRTTSKKKTETPLEYFASKLNQPISPDYLKKICRLVIEVSPSDCIQARVMMEACKLLYNPKLLINDIAYDLEFKDSTYFSRFFKKYAGQSPSIARAKILETI